MGERLKIVLKMAASASKITRSISMVMCDETWRFRLGIKVKSLNVISALRGTVNPTRTEFFRYSSISKIQGAFHLEQILATFYR